MFKKYNSREENNNRKLLLKKNNNRKLSKRELIQEEIIIEVKEDKDLEKGNKTTNNKMKIIMKANKEEALEIITIEDLKTKETTIIKMKLR